MLGLEYSTVKGDYLHHVVQLSSSQVTSFRDWRLRVDDRELYTFGDKGRLELTIPKDSQSLEILDNRDAVRFFGLWDQYSGKKEITIEVGGKGLNMHQVVSASRISQSSWEVTGEIDVIQVHEQPEKGTAQTSDWLKERSDLLLQKTNLGGGSPVIRGMSGNRVLLMVDGFRLNNSIYRLGLNQYLNTTPASSLEQIEVLSGPSGVQYGSDGLGGTVHLRGADPASLGEPNLQYRGYLSSSDQTHTQQISGHGNKNNLFVQGHFKFNSYENLEAADPVGEQIPTGYDSWDGSLNFTYKPNAENRIRFINTNSHASNVPRTDRIQSGRDLLWEYHPQKMQLHGLRYESETARSFSDFMDLGVGYMRQEEGTRRISTGNPNRLTEDHTLVETLQLNGTFTKLTQKVQWIYGFDHQADQVDANATQTLLNEDTTNDTDAKFPNDSAYNTYGLFAVADTSLTDHMRVKVGLRQTWAHLEGTLGEPIGLVDETFNQLTPSLTWSLDKDHYFFSLGASQGFRAPNLEDSLALGPSNSGFDAPNPNLQPEELWSYEANFRYRTETSFFEANAYTSQYSNLIEKVPGSWQGSNTFDGEPVFILDNVGKAEVNGLSLRYRHRFNDQHAINADGSWTEGTQTDRDEPMRRIPPLRGNLSWIMDRSKLRVSGVFSWAARQDRLSSGDISDSRIPEDGTPGYGVFHLRGRYEFTPRFGLNLAVENLADKLYKQHGSGIFEPGRRAVMELTAKWR